MGTRRVLVVDDSAIIRTAIADLIQRSLDDWQVCGEAADGVDAIRKTAELAPDLALIDLSLPLRNGLEVAKTLHEFHPTLKIVIMSEQDAGMLSHISSEYGFESLAKSQLFVDLVALLRRLSEA